MDAMFWLENLKSYSEDLGIDGRILIMNLRGSRVGGCRLDVSGSG
jgi:hypothetical protein